MSGHIKHRFSNQIDVFQQHQKDADNTYSKRSSLNIPDYSAVTDNQNNRFQTDTNEISWLDKFAQDNQKVCHSRLFDQNNTKIITPQVTNEMKFSFNMNYSDQKSIQTNLLSSKHTQNYIRNQSPYSNYNSKNDKNSILSDIQNTQANSKNRNRKDSIVGSIKKNKKSNNIFGEVTQYQRQIAQATPLSKLQQMNDKLSRVLLNDPKSIAKLGKQNIKNQSSFKQISSGNIRSPFVPSRIEKFEDNSRYFERISEKHFGKQSVIPKQKPEKNASQPNSKNQISNYLQILFNRLDRSQSGQLSRSNCSTDLIPEEFKFLFGGIFTKVKLKQVILSKAQFIRQCQNAIKQVDLNQLSKLFAQLKRPNDPSYEQKSNQNIFEISKKITFNQEQWSDINNSHLYRQEEGEKLCKQVRKSHFSVENKGQNISKSVLSSSKIYIDDLDGKNTKINGNLFHNFDIAIDKKSKNNDENFLSKFERQRQKQKYPLDNKDLFSEGTNYKRKKLSMNDLTLEQHRKSIDNLNKLNQRIESCLSGKAYDKSSGRREQRLKFDELVRHV